MTDVAGFGDLIVGRHNFRDRASGVSTSTVLGTQSFFCFFFVHKKEVLASFHSAATFGSAKRTEITDISYKISNGKANKHIVNTSGGARIAATMKQPT